MPKYIVNISSQNNDTLLMQMENGQLHAFYSPVPINVTIPDEYVHGGKFVVEKETGIIHVCAYGFCE